MARLSERENLEECRSEDPALRIEGFRPVVDRSGLEPTDEIEYAASVAMGLDDPATNPNAHLYPNGQGRLAWPVRIVDQENVAQPDVDIRFEVVPIRPICTGTRSENEVAARFPRRSQLRARQAIRSGEIRCAGTTPREHGRTDAHGIAVGIYQVSHTGGNQPGVGREVLRASLEHANLDLVIDIGFDWLVAIPEIRGGLTVSGAVGRHVHRDLTPRLMSLGRSVAGMRWPHPAVVTSAALRWGGLYPPHMTHRWGAEIDFRPMSFDGHPCSHASANYDFKRTQLLVWMLESHGARTIYFNDPRIAGAHPLAGHDDHLHVSFAQKKPHAYSITCADRLQELNSSTDSSSAVLC